MHDVLVLHRDADVLERCLKHLSDEHSVVTTTDFDEALEEVRSGVDCVVVGYELADDTGFGFVEATRGYADVPYVLLTDRLDEEVVRGVAGSDVAEYVHLEPGNEEVYRDLRDRVERVVEVGGGLDRYRALVENADDAMYALDSDGRFRMVNQSYVDLTGNPRDELLGRHPREFLEESEVGKVEDVIKELLREDRKSGMVEIRVEDDGEETVYEENIIVVTDSEGEFRGTVGVLRDITERKRREEELERYETMLNTVPDMVWALDEEGYLIAANETARHVIGSSFDSSNIIGVHASEWMTEEELRKGEEYVRELLSGDGENEASYEIDLKIGDEPVPGEAHMAVLTDQDGRFRGTAGVTRDISDRKKRERKIREQREQLEILNRIVRHDIRNDMNVVRGWTEIALEHTDGEGREYLDRVLEITDGVVETTESVKQLMDAITTGEAELEPIDLNEILGSEVRKAGMSFSEAEFVAHDFPGVTVEANQMLSAVFGNLLNNAVRHNDNDEPRVEVGVEDSGDEVVVWVADNGSGIPDHTKDEVFGRGEKGLESPGTGIGLYLVDTLVEQFGGEVWVEDNEPRGAVFKVRLRKTDGSIRV